MSFNEFIPQIIDKVEGIETVFHDYCLEHGKTFIVQKNGYVIKDKKTIRIFGDKFDKTFYAGKPAACLIYFGSELVFCANIADIRDKSVQFNLRSSQYTPVISKTHNISMFDFMRYNAPPPCPKDFGGEKREYQYSFSRVLCQETLYGKENHDREDFLRIVKGIP